jgi:peptide/nickel transport system ATP-binding protein
VIEALHLCKRYVQGRWYSQNKFQVTALDDVSLTIQPRSSVALVGESGAGKSTLGRCLSCLEQPDSGEIRFEGKNLLIPRPKESIAMRRSVQFIFQDSATAMNPRFSAAEVVEEPFRIQTSMGKKSRRMQALAMLEQVGISPEWAGRPALEFSGGQRQRLCIARALVLKPRLLILDEALSSLDLPMQTQIADLLLAFQGSLSLALLFITHDLRLAARITDRIVVMQKGRIVESDGLSAV